MSEIKEISIKDALAPVSIKTTEIILDQMKNCVCKIHKGNINGTGFFLRITYNNNLYDLLITNNHVLNEQDIKADNIINISLNDGQIYQEIKMDEKRKKYSNEKYDITIIEIKKEDNFNHFLILDDAILNNDINNYKNIYKDESLYILNYINGKYMHVSYGILNNIEENKIIHKCNTDTGSSGSPIILLNNNKVIGVHYGGSKHNHNFNFNFGTLLKRPLLEYIKIYNKKLNYIIAEIEIKEEDVGEDIQIINSFEEFKRNDKNNFIYDIKEKDYFLYENEKEIKENCKIRINNNNINFNYYYKFNKKGKYTIQYIFTNNLTKTDYMFSECELITNINLSNFNTQNVTNMKGMFHLCESLTNIDLSNFNTRNVINMSHMFSGCISLTSINLSDFKTQNVINMVEMFCFCCSLKKLNLSNFNTQNITDLSSMFYSCNSLKKENIITKDKYILGEFEDEIENK